MGDVTKFKACDLRANQLVVQESDFDAALAREAALREKIRQLNIRDTGKSSLITDLESRLERANARNASLIKRNDRLKWQRNGTRLELDTSQSELAALREELAASRKNTEFAQESMQIFADEADKLQQRLTIAEQRNVEALELLAETSKAILRHQAEQPMSHRLAGLLTKARSKVDRYLKANHKATESGASE